MSVLCDLDRNEFPDIPSMRKIHCHAATPRAPFKLVSMPYAIRPLKLPASACIENKMPMREASSFLLYHKVTYSGAACTNASAAPMTMRRPAMVA